MTPAGPTLFQGYCEALRRHAHRLIAEGYERMDKTAFAGTQEPAITGELVREMRAFLKIASRLSRDQAKYRTVPPRFAHQRVYAGLHHTYASHHLRSKGAAPILIHHVLLRFE